MASYHLSAQIITRGAGHSAVAAAAYRSRCELVDERTGLVHDYSRKSGELLFEGIYAPKDAPDWARDRAQLWNHVEAFERRRDAQLCREFIIALPHELTLEQNRFALQDWVRDNFTRHGLIADVAIHKPDRHGDQRNIHAHVMVVMRKLDGTEFLHAKERFETVAERKAEMEALRESWARAGNRHLERYGFEPTLDHRTLKAQGIEREPTIHMGKAATAIERKGKRRQTSELGHVNRAVKVENEKRVIDLAAERSMREARDAARGRVDHIRPQNPSRDFSFQKSAREAAGAREPAAAPSATRQPTTRTTEARSAAATASREAGKVERAAEKTVGKASGIFGRGILGALAGLLKLFDLFPAAPPSPEQQQRNHQAAKEQQATDELAAAKEAYARQLLERISRDDQERARRARERGGRDDDYGGRER
jgi:hypothetical protein